MDLGKLNEVFQNTNLDNAIEVQGETLEEALKRGAASLKTSIINLDYEVIQRGKKGFIGMGKQNFIIKVWKTGELDLSQIGQGPASTEDFEVDLNVPRDGDAKIKIKKAGIFLKVLPPKNGGKGMELKEVENMLYRRGVHYFNKNKIKKITGDEKGDWVKIGEWVPNPEYDSKLSISLSTDEMEASVIMSAPIYSGRTLEPEEIINALESEGVKFGILYDKIKEVAEDEIVNIPVVVARGQGPQHGKNSQLLYKFKTGLENSVQLTEEEKGRVDFKNLNRVQNVIAGQILAEKVPATLGVPGRTVTNNIIDARDGKDMPLRSGKNTRLSKDGLKIYSEKDGQVFLSGADITVREIYEVRGDVDFNIGNIDFVGTVIVHGNVLQNFRIKAAGDIRVSGVVQRAELIAEGKVYCKGGIKGGNIKANKSIYARYIDNAEINVNGDVVAREEIINCKINAGGRVICLTGKGGIIGGEIIAGQQIIAKRLGSESYTGTYLEAGVDPNIKNKLIILEKQKDDLSAKFDILLKSIDKLDEEQKAGKLNRKKEKILVKMQKAKEEYSKKLALYESKIRKLSQYLMNIENNGSISAKYVAFPGVKTVIKNAEYEIRSEYKSVTFKYSAGLIKPDKYSIDESDFRKSLSSK